MLDILLVDDEPSILLAFDEALRAEGHRVVTASDGLSAQASLAERSYDVVLCDVRMPRLDGLKLFKRVRRDAPATRCILMTAYAAVPDAVEALKLGAVDYLAKPFELEELLALVARIDRERELARRFAALREAPEARPAPDGLVGTSAPMARLLDRVARFARSEAPVLISGERGTGKELVARALHQRSDREGQPFVVVSCAALPPHLLEAELFGHQPLDGEPRRPGQLAAAAGGTLYLDEVSEVPLGTQTKLLKLLQDRAYQPLGGHRSEPLEARLVAGTTAPLGELVARRLFREDLAHRLKVLELRVPPLRERGGDLLPLIDHLLRRLAQPASPPSVTARALAALAQHPFPGNVRELEQLLQYALVVSGGRQLDLPHLPPELAAGEDQAQPERHRSLPEAVREFEREYIRRTVRRTRGNRTSAAALLGISRKNLWEKLRGFGLSDEDLEPSGPHRPPRDLEES